MRAWVDESGDAGTGGAGSQWLVLVAVCCPERDVPALTAAISTLCSRLPPGALAATSFSRLSHDAKRGFLAAAAGLDADWQARAVAFDTRRLVVGPLSRPNLLYNYAFRWALEQAVNCAAQIREPAEVAFERQTRTGDPARLLDYVRRLERLQVSTIDWALFGADRLYPIGKGEEPGLFLADAVAHAVYRALEPDARWDGLTDPSYLELIERRVTRIRRFPGR